MTLMPQYVPTTKAIQEAIDRTPHCLNKFGLVSHTRIAKVLTALSVRGESRICQGITEMSPMAYMLKKTSTDVTLKPSPFAHTPTYLQTSGMTFHMLEETIRKMQLNVPRESIRLMFATMDVNQDKSLDVVELITGEGESFSLAVKKQTFCAAQVSRFFFATRSQS